MKVKSRVSFYPVFNMPREKVPEFRATIILTPESDTAEISQDILDMIEKRLRKSYSDCSDLQVDLETKKLNRSTCFIFCLKTKDATVKDLVVRLSEDDLNGFKITISGIVNQVVNLFNFGS